MNVKLLIDGIVRQTTVLIAQLSTAAGSRSPLSRVTDEVFLSLAREIEAQGVRRQVVADMFGMALRSYQKKMQRLTEGATQRDRTLWEAVLDFVTQERPTRARILARFAKDGEKEVVAVLSDLLRTGLVFTTGSGRSAVFGPTQDDLRQAVLRDHDRESLENWLWLMVFRSEIATVADAYAALSAERELIDAALEELIASGRLKREGERLVSSNLVVPYGNEQGWETAVLDHFRTVAVAIAKKVAAGITPSAESDQIGGSTFTFTVGPGHPYEQDVRNLLRSTRRTAQALWDDVARFNEQHPPDPVTASRVSFYTGQLVERLMDDEPERVAEVGDE
ncbi:MAG TPA: hypothetical protein VHM70_15980 [Polyangiaceae bacterium]|jgi:hypothetical protein|nr:hypothetical protein [Polyangiaceae bacterium]